MAKPGDTVNQTPEKSAATPGAPGGKRRVTVGISDMKIGNDPNSSLITHSLGPCIGLILFAPRIPGAGLLHYQLPTRKGHEERAKTNPAMFADVAIPRLLVEMEKMGAKKDQLVASIFGGASMLKDDQIFKIGIQNARAAKKILWQLCLRITNEDIGGNSSRTVEIDVATGRIRLHKDGQNQFFH